MATWVAQRIEQNLLPTPDILSWNGGKAKQVSLSTCQKIRHFVGNLFGLIGNLACMPFAAAYSLVGKIVSWFKPTPKKAPVDEIIDPSALPAHFGFADSLFQTSGLGTQYSATKLSDKAKCDWEKWLNPKRIEGTKPGEYRKFFIDVLRNPDEFIKILTKMNATAHRFSLEWSVIEPEPGKYDEEAIALYRTFMQKLKNNGIEPYVTLHHFVCPEWFAEKGGFDKLENVELFKRHAVEMMERFRDEVTNWMPFNEINIDAFQKSVRGVYPPGREGDIAGAARMMRNMLLAHCQIYKAAKEKGLNVQIGSTHQWLNFEPLEGNCLERLICYFLSKITHYACYNFFKTGQFSLEMPGKANVQFSIPKEEFEKYNGFSDFIGVQFYGYPRLKAGFNGFHDYPGYKIINQCGLTFGSTCPRGGEVMSFGPSVYPESLEKCLTQAAALNKPIVISETGGDARVQKDGEKDFKLDDAAQKRVFAKMFPILKKFKERMKAFFVWTVVRGHLEWERGGFPQLGVVNILKNQNHDMVGHTLSPAAELIQDVYGQKREQLGLAQPIAAIA